MDDVAAARHPGRRAHLPPDARALLRARCGTSLVDNGIMALTLDHVFVCTAAGAPGAELLVAAGFTEGPRNVHPGQGTACRRFFFDNAYLELLWVEDEAEARSPSTAPTRLWQRWRDRADGHTCPFGVGLHAADGAAAPFPTWSYRPSYLRPDMALRVATNGEALHEPMLFLTPGSPAFRGTAVADRADAGPGSAHRSVHACGVRAVTRVTLAGPATMPSAPLTAVVAARLVERVVASDHALSIGFDGELAGRALDLRPALPLILRW